MRTVVAKGGGRWSTGMERTGEQVARKPGELETDVPEEAGCGPVEGAPRALGRRLPKVTT